MKLKHEIVEEIKNLTSNRYEKYELQLDDICKELEIECFDANFDDPRISGMLIKDQKTNKFNIYVNRKHSDTRQRFTIAHEIGHYLSYKHKSYSYEQLNENNQIEDYAISFFR